MRRPQDANHKRKLAKRRKMRNMMSMSIVINLPQEIYQSMDLPVENIDTNTQRGRPQINIALLAEGRPRMTGLLYSNS